MAEGLGQEQSPGSGVLAPSLVPVLSKTSRGRSGGETSEFDAPKIFLEVSL